MRQDGIYPYTTVQEIVRVVERAYDMLIIARDLRIPIKWVGDKSISFESGSTGIYLRIPTAISENQELGEALDTVSRALTRWRRTLKLHNNEIDDSVARLIRERAQPKK